MKFLRSLVLELLHWDQIEQAVAHWRFSIPTTLGMVGACLLWFLGNNATEGAIIFVFVLTTAMVGGLIWDKKTPGRPGEASEKGKH